MPAITSADNLAQQSAESRTETPAQFVLYRGDTGYVSSDSQDEEDDDDISQAAYLGSSRGGNLAQIGQQSDSVESSSEELSSEDSALSLAQIGQDSSSSGNENSEDAPHTYPGGSDAEDGGILAQVEDRSMMRTNASYQIRPPGLSPPSPGCLSGGCFAQIARESREHTCYDICLEGDHDEKACEEMCSELKQARYGGLAQIGST